ncbi:MAG: ATP-binding protein [Firmicutes bacterium]|nr:ATP-binding protein [Bacillota bacterium]
MTEEKAKAAAKGLEENNGFSRVAFQPFWPSYPAKSDAEVYTCPLCRDTGWLMGEDGAYPCDCRREKQMAARKQAAGLQPALLGHTLDAFRLDYYSDFLTDPEGRTYRRLAENACQACRDFVADVTAGKRPRGLFFQGEVGRGKTFLAAAVVNALIDRGCGALFTVVPDLLDSLRYSYDPESETSEETLMNRVRQAPVLVLDDLGSHNYSEWTKNRMYALLNYRLNHNLPLIVTSNLDLEQLKDILGLRVISRIVECCDFYLLCADKDNRLKVRAGCK